MKIGERWSDVAGRPSGFDYLRIFLATAVLVWHSYQIAAGNDAARAVWVSAPIGYCVQLIIPCFFALSGFLVAGSMYRNPNLLIFLSLRAIRIFPALVVEVSLAALVLGPIFTKFPLGQYFRDPELSHYMLNMVGWIHYVLPGVFLYNPVPRTVNNQLWTVPFELECYFVITIISIIGFFRHKSRVIPLFVALTLAAGLSDVIFHNHVIHVGIYSGRVLVLSFLSGVVIYSYKDSIPWRADFAVASMLIAMALLNINDVTVFAAPFFAAYLTVYLGLLNPRKSIIVKSGDYSYGLYIYSFGIQQAVQESMGFHISWWTNALISLPITLLFALFSWWCVEKPFGKVRRFVLLNKAKT